MNLVCSCTNCVHAQRKRRKLAAPSPLRDIPKASSRLRVPSPPPVPTVSERERKEGKKKKASGSAADASAGFVDVYGAEVGSLGRCVHMLVLLTAKYLASCAWCQLYFASD